MYTINLNNIPGRTAIANGKEYLFFSGYAYLAMAHVPAFTELVKEGIDKYGILFPSSRISNTRLQLYEECEALLSSITQCEETVLMSSGFMAGKLAVEPWREEVYNLSPSHPSVTTSITGRKSSHVVAVDSVDPLHACVTNFSFINNQCINICVVDDSHGIGLIGKNGNGITGQLPEKNTVEYIITYSLSKACNITAGAVSCNKKIAQKLRALPAYTASTSASPAFIFAFIHAQQLYQQQREKLQQNVKYFQSIIRELSQIKFHPELPIFILPSAIDEVVLLQKNIIISSFAYPDPAGEKIQRIVLNALHTKEDLEYVANVLTQLFGGGTGIGIS